MELLNLKNNIPHRNRNKNGDGAHLCKLFIMQESWSMFLLTRKGASSNVYAKPVCLFLMQESWSMFLAKRKLLQTMSAPNICVLPLAVPIPVYMYLDALELEWSISLLWNICSCQDILNGDVLVKHLWLLFYYVTVTPSTSRFPCRRP